MYGTSLFVATLLLLFAVAPASQGHLNVLPSQCRYDSIEVSFLIRKWTIQQYS
ncbi:uncharacterized protein P174DRAFT_437081 [Aspergillus novofumigatus IBT 16806]|uniref:Uncharacterized protein n=1 Tax=Aspergillus novofumigatus (strain IBT 16806) TaxID=1392255 RepID=A0A2I1CM38_ASPN1|nr:uncharacterized protein P174DRAFT_437081 [Aspergillus novofumigatus IBT 16806]PKX98665.1 hypothetical protein P174DRAFT_437081 [Aspergillus novofumigatus IBT 16806]